MSKWIGEESSLDFLGDFRRRLHVVGNAVVDATGCAEHLLHLDILVTQMSSDATAKD